MHYTLGADVVVIGPQTGLADLQADFHDRFDMPAPFTDNQLPDQVVVQARASATALHVRQIRITGVWLSPGQEQAIKAF